MGNLRCPCYEHRETMAMSTLPLKPVAGPYQLTRVCGAQAAGLFHCIEVFWAKLWDPLTSQVPRPQAQKFVLQ